MEDRVEASSPVVEAPKPVRKPAGVTFNIESNEEIMPKKRPVYNLTPQYGITSLLSGKPILLFLTVLKSLVRLFVIAFEFSKVLRLVQPDMVNFPILNEDSWSGYRNELLRHLAVSFTRELLDSALLVFLLWKDFIFKLWNYHQIWIGKTVRKSIQSSRWLGVLESASFAQVIGLGWLAKEYLLGAFVAAFHLGMRNATNSFPHQVYSPLVMIGGFELATVGVFLFWEFLGDLRWFTHGSVLTIFFGHLTALLLEPTRLVLRLRYGPLVPVDSNSEIYDILAGLVKICSYPLGNIFINRRSLSVSIRSCGFRTLSSIIIDSKLISFLDEYAQFVKGAFPETSGPDDADQMLLAAVTHDIGHAMTGQILWYNGLGYGLVYGLMAWILFEVLMKRPILFRSFGFRTSPIPAICVILIALIELQVIWQLALTPLSNCISWVKELEADSYAASFGFGINLQKLLYIRQAGTTSLYRSFTCLHAIFTETHPPYSQRVNLLK